MLVLSHRLLLYCIWLLYDLRNFTIKKDVACVPFFWEEACTHAKKITKYSNIGSFNCHWHQKQAKCSTWDNVVDRFGFLPPNSAFHPWFSGEVTFFLPLFSLFFGSFFRLFFPLSSYTVGHSIPQAFVMFCETSISETTVTVTVTSCYYWTLVYISIHSTVSGKISHHAEPKSLLQPKNTSLQHVTHSSRTWLDRYTVVAIQSRFGTICLIKICSIEL